MQQIDGWAKQQSALFFKALVFVGHTTCWSHNTQPKILQVLHEFLDEKQPEGYKMVMKRKVNWNGAKFLWTRKVLFGIPTCPTSVSFSNYSGLPSDEHFFRHDNYLVELGY
jgi:hypothetical protein